MQIDSGGREESTENHGVMHKQTGHLHGRDIYKPCKLFQKKREKGLRVGELVFQTPSTKESFLVAGFSFSYLLLRDVK